MSKSIERRIAIQKDAKMISAEKILIDITREINIRIEDLKIIESDYLEGAIVVLQRLKNKIERGDYGNK